MVVDSKHHKLERSLVSNNVKMFKETVDEMESVPVDIQMKLVLNHYDDMLEYLIYEDKLSPETYSLSAATDEKIQKLIKCKKLKDR